ncbi:unnamed protein product [Paramecium primaurelia]|uniref:WD40-repeat-containing domain n=1 Tax=Paramecium primaurelia TaxID=5886 RepID=A0A8S1NQB1_PARPR|nr:unnamed protein product [Paramecium primaurelia]
MQSIQSQTLSINQYTIAKIEEYFFRLDQEVELAFTKIDESIDSILFIPFKFEIPQLQTQIPQFVQLSESDFNFTSQILESVSHLIKQMIQNKINKKQQKLNQQEENLLQRDSQINNNQEEYINKNKNFLEEDIDSQQLQNIQFDSILIEGNQENNSKIQKEVIQVDMQQKQQEQQLIINQQVELKLIDDSNQQSGYCFAIVFDTTGQIMISCEYEKIKIWNFEQGRLKLINTYSEHKDTVTCLVYSKVRNNFISGSHDNTIICWQQINQNDWKCSQPFKQHNKTVNCLMLNKQEDQLISGGCNHSIKVWNVDFIKNELNFQYSLDKHSNSVESFSFNSSETILVSCGYTDFIIWEKGAQGKWEFKYRKYVSDSGHKIYLINDQQLLWVTLSVSVDDILVFEIQNGIFQQNINKTIKLNKNNECLDDSYFPIIQNKDKNIILVRHKHYIYLIRQLNYGTFNITVSLDCQNDKIYGTMTNNGQYLVFWDNKQMKYQSYEILNK